MIRTFNMAALLLLMLCISGCQKDNPKKEVFDNKELTVLFSPGASFSGAGYDDAILKAVMESVADNPQVKYRLLRPDTIDQARIFAQEWQESAGEHGTLILCGIQYEALAPTLAPGKGRVLLLDSRQTLENGVSTLQLKRYGGAWLAGALCAGFSQVCVIKALDGDRMMDTVADGIEAGYSDTAEKEAKRLVLSDSYRGANMPDELFSYLYINGTHGMDLDIETILAPVCGASRMGAYAFSNNYFVFSIGIGEDCSAFCDILPFSLIYDLGGIVKDYICQWLEGKSWPSHREFGLSTGHVYIQYNPRYFATVGKRLIMRASPCLFTEEQYKAWEAQYRETALEKEATHAY